MRLPILMQFYKKKIRQVSNQLYYKKKTTTKIMQYIAERVPIPPIILFFQLLKVSRVWKTFTDEFKIRCNVSFIKLSFQLVPLLMAKRGSKIVRSYYEMQSSQCSLSVSHQSNLVLVATQVILVYKQVQEEHAKWKRSMVHHFTFKID